MGLGLGLGLGFGFGFGFGLGLVCAVSCQRINVVHEKSSRSGSSVTVSLIEVSASFGRQNSLMNTGGKYAPVSESMTSTWSG